MPGFSRSSSVAFAFSRHRSSRRLICWNEIWRERSCSCSLGGLTSQERNERSSMSGAQSAGFHEMSFDTAAHGWLRKEAWRDY